MRNDTTFALGASRFFAVCAIVAGVAAGILEATLGAGFVCFDYCPYPADYFSRLFPGLALLLIPCIVLSLLALGAFLWHCGARGQRSRANKQVIFFLVGGGIGGAVLGSMLLLGSVILPVTSDGILVERPLETWAHLWGLAILLVAASWTGILARLSWPAE